MKAPTAADVIPILDLKLQYRSIKAEMDRAVLAVLEAAQFVLGPEVERFEKDFAAYLGVKHFVCTQSGTSALSLMLKSAGIGPGDEVVTTPITFFATVEAILECGATPVFADVDPRTLNIDPKAVAKVLSKKTKALLPVHLYGQPADMDALAQLAQKNGLLLFEDSAQAAGSLHKGKKAGSLGKAAAFSFYPGKNLGAYGDAGGVATDDDAVALGVRRRRNHGGDKKNQHLVLATNERLETLQGAVLGVKLPHLDAWNAGRRRHAASYRRLLAGAKDLSIVEELPGMSSNHHLFVVRHPRRDALLARLHEERILADIHYPACAHLQDVLGPVKMKPGSLPVAERAVTEILSLPMFAELTDAQVERVAGVVRAFTG